MKYFIMVLLFSCTVPLIAQAGLESGNEFNILEEAGYVLAMETVFTGLSLLSTTKHRIGPIGTGIADTTIGLLGVPGILQAIEFERYGDATGLALISAGFIAKSVFNFIPNPDLSKKQRFWINFISYNVLVFSGYLITETG